MGAAPGSLEGAEVPGVKRALAMLALGAVFGLTYVAQSYASRIEKLEAALETLRGGCGQRSAGLQQQLNIWKSSAKYERPEVR